MTGSVQAKNGIFYVVINMKDKTGKRKQKWINTQLPEKNNKREAEKILIKKLAEYERNNLAYISNPSFVDYMYLWLDQAKMSLEQNTYESYRYVIKAGIDPFFRPQKVNLENLTPLHIQRYYQHKIDLGVNPNTVLAHNAIIRKALKDAVKMELIPNNPAEKVFLPKRKKYVGSFYTVEEVNDFLKATKDEPVNMAFFLTAFYGLRRSELLGLKWKNIDFANKLLTIKSTVVRNETIVEKDKTKSESSNRILPIPDVVLSMLKKHRLRQREFRILCGSCYYENDYVCKWENGLPFKPDYISRKMQRVIRDNGLKKIRYHDLRHSCASMLFANGFSLKEIQEWLGHSDIRTTANIYTHMLFDSKKGMADTLSGKVVVDF